MSGLPERDVRLWLHNKLEEPWSSSKISSFITSDILKLISQKFNVLDPVIKIRILFSLLIVRKYLFKELEKEIEQIIQLGLTDDDEWVRVISSLLITFPSKGTIAYQEIQKNENFRKLFDDVSKKRTYTLTQMEDSLSFEFQPHHTREKQNFLSLSQYLFNISLLDIMCCVCCVCCVLC
jgi:hypothetical protein